MNKYFEHARLFQGDCFIADYTQMTHCDRGVEIAEKPFEDIAFCQLKNPNEIVFWGVNFEECSSFFKNPVTKTSISQCECMFVSAHAKKKGWVCLIEMKYCLEKNIEDNAQKAYKQLFETMTYLKEKGVLNEKDYRFYLNYSVPDYSNREPFSAFRFTPEELLCYKKQGMSILGYNNLLILNEGYIKVPL